MRIEIFTLRVGGTSLAMALANRRTNRSACLEQFFILDRFANLISKLNFYKLIPYPMDKCYSGRRRPARQTSEKDVLWFHRPAGP